MYGKKQEKVFLETPLSKLKQGYWPFVLYITALYIGLFSNSSELGSVVQLASVGLFALAGIILVLTNTAKLRKVSRFEVLLICMCFTSYVSCLYFMAFDGVDLSYSLIYATVLLSVVFFMGFIAQVATPELLLRASAVAYALMIVTVLFFKSDSYLSALAIGADERWSLRFMPFDMHPNLVGFVFGGGAIILFYRAVLESSKGGRGVVLLLLLISVSFIFAASARASLLAIAISSMTVFLLKLPRLGLKAIAFTVFLIFVLVLISLVKYEDVFSYISDVLELDSSTRGIDSGATGRTELWSMGVNLIFSDPVRTMIGGGLRSATPDLIGFSTESSYITILLESGVVLGLFFIGAIVRFAFCLASSLRRRDSLYEAYFLHIIIFVLVQSVFNRYLLAVGNPLSLILLFSVIVLARRNFLLAK